MFIGRSNELNFLKKLFTTKGGQLVVVYGRRRIGKTELLRKFCEGKRHIFYSCTESPDIQQLAAFSERILREDVSAARYVTTFADWRQAFESISELPSDEKKLAVIDEFPYMVRGNRAIPSMLQNLWDEKLKDENVMIILCGSAMSFIEKEILAEKNPLYGRATGVLKINEMNFFDAVKFIPHYNADDKIATYATLGGVPHYLKQFNDELTLGENIRYSIFQRGSVLYSEVEFLMRQELRETAIYNAIIEAIALGSTKLNEIHQKTQIEKTKLSAYLKNLIELGIIRREFSVLDGVKEQANVQRGLYRVADNFFRFWYTFVFPNLSELEAGDAEGVWRYAAEPELNRYVSLPFEDVCRQYLRHQNMNEGLPFRFSKIGRWWNKTDELDIMAFDAKKENFLLGECKYKNAPFDLGDLKNMQGKFPAPGGANVFYALFSKSGFTRDVVDAAGKQNMLAVSINDIIGV